MSMLSKEEKLRYGQLLRQQMKQKEERKKQEDMIKRGGQPYIPKTQSDRVLLQQPIFIPDPKEALQKKLETQDYNPFGKAGGGAPNRRQPSNANNSAELSSPNMRLPVQQETYTHANYPPYQSGTYNSDYVNQPNNDSSLKQMQQQQQIQQQQYMQQQQQQQFYAPQEHQRSNNEYGPVRQPYPQQPMTISPQTIPRKYQQLPVNYYPEPMQRPYQQVPAQQQRIYQQPQRQYIPQQINPQIQRSRTLQNEQMQQMYKRGGRNLLKLQNQTVNQHLVKQKQKLEMQAFLKQQMEEVQRRKQQEKERLKRQQLEEQKRNRDYIEAQNQKLRDQERRKNQQKQRIIDQNLKNLAMRKELQQQAKDKLEREKLQAEKRREDHERERQRLQAKRDQIVQQKPGRLLGKQDDTSSLSSSSSEQNTHGKGFNTDISREFFRKERQKQPVKNRNDKKLQLFTQEIQKMRDQINNQGELFQKEIQRIKRQNQANLHDKRKAQLEIQKLRIQLEKKNKQSEIRLYEALKRNDPNFYQPPPQYQQYPYRPPPFNNQQFANQQQYEQPRKVMQPNPPKPMAKKNRVQQYEAKEANDSFVAKPSYNNYNKQQPDYQPRNKFQQSEVMTLDADSKKVPVSIPSNTKLTMSKIQNYGKDTMFYQQPPKNNYKQRERPIQEEEQQHLGSRKSQRHDDELDRLVQSRTKKQWEMSTVKDDITKQIEQLLKKKDKQQLEGQPSQMSQAGRQILSRGALPYDGPNLNSLNSNKVSLVSNGTMDVDRIYERNQNRLRELRALGVQTINTTNDEDLNRLNSLLRDYH